MRLLKPYSAVIDLATMIFKWAGGFLAVVGVGGYFGWNWYQGKQQAKAEEVKQAAAAQAAQSGG